MSQRGKTEPDVREVRVTVGDVELGGSLGVPPGAEGLVLFAHGSGSSRFSPRNRAVARVLRASGLGTLLFDLLGEAEEEEDERTGELRFDIPFLARRLAAVTEWARRQPELAHLRFGYFGSSTGAAAALVAAAMHPDSIHAVVSRGGRPDLAGAALAKVQSPTLLIVGADDVGVLELNEAALARLEGLKDIRLVLGATHLFEEPGALEEVSRLAADWFSRYLGGARPEMHP